MNTRKYMVAYGMNTNLAQMALRCPAAKSLGPVKLKDHKLAFKLFCDAVASEGNSMDCVLWTITDNCESALDRLEGYPDFYGKKEVTVLYRGQPIKAMIYYMTDFYKASLPSEHYLKTVTEGYLDHNMDLEQIYRAIDEVTEYEYNSW